MSEPSSNEPKIGTLPRAWYGEPISKFLARSPDDILGQLTRNSDFPVVSTQRSAWLGEIEILKAALLGLTGTVFLEFTIPRMGRRVDAVVLLGPAILVLEFKVGGEEFDQQGIEQVWDYGLDLKNFHEASHKAPIIPILVATETKHSPAENLQVDADGVYQPLLVRPRDLRPAMERMMQLYPGQAVDGEAWAAAPYRPTPSIVEAARALYAQHSVAAIARSDAGAKNLAITSRRVEELVVEAREKKQKAICFVTGVPGAGKTLVGLDVATRRRDESDPAHAVYLSGNGPLVKVLCEALTRDEVHRQESRGKKIRKGVVGGRVKAFIQNVHHFRDEALTNNGSPDERVVIFDEAQRAWDLQQTARFMSRRKNIPEFAHSEAEFLISYMDRHADWSFIVCLVGGGQEINTGEAGIDAWLDAIRAKFPHWNMHISPQLTDNEYAAGQALNYLTARQGTYFDPALHLATSMRSFRAEKVSDFVKALLDCDRPKARAALEDVSPRYPVVVTRNLASAKLWVRERARGSERYGLVASSKAQRLKPHAIDVRVEVDPKHWFLNGKGDTRSSYYLEDAATEFQVQGLELDWVCVTWDADLRYSPNGWTHHDFRGKSWCNIGVAEKKRYQRNAYRVLLTRARQGMAIFVPPGDPDDPTRRPEFYDETYSYLREIGIPELT